MRTLLPDPPPPGFEELLERRRRWGADRHDEVWEGVLHVAPAAQNRHGELVAQLLVVLDPLARPRSLTPIGEFNVGDPDDFRVPDAGLLRPSPNRLWNPTAALVVEVLSPGDETWDKLPFYAAHHVDELLVVDHDRRSVTWLALGPGGTYTEAAGSSLVDLTVAELGRRLDWPE